MESSTENINFTQMFTKQLTTVTFLTISDESAKKSEQKLFRDLVLLIFMFRPVRSTRDL